MRVAVCDDLSADDTATLFTGIAGATTTVPKPASARASFYVDAPPSDRMRLWAPFPVKRADVFGGNDGRAIPMTVYPLLVDAVYKGGALADLSDLAMFFFQDIRFSEMDDGNEAFTRSMYCRALLDPVLAARALRAMGVDTDTVDAIANKVSAHQQTVSDRLSRDMAAIFQLKYGSQQNVARDRPLCLLERLGNAYAKDASARAMTFGHATTQGAAWWAPFVAHALSEMATPVQISTYVPSVHGRDVRMTASIAERALRAMFPAFSPATLRVDATVATRTTRIKIDGGDSVFDVCPLIPCL